MAQGTAFCHSSGRPRLSSLAPDSRALTFAGIWEMNEQMSLSQIDSRSTCLTDVPVRCQMTDE